MVFQKIFGVETWGKGIVLKKLDLWNGIRRSDMEREKKDFLLNFLPYVATVEPIWVGKNAFVLLIQTKADNVFPNCFSIMFLLLRKVSSYSISTLAISTVNSTT